MYSQPASIKEFVCLRPVSALPLLARRRAHAQGLAETLCGSPLYMAPEILQLHKYDAKVGGAPTGLQASGGRCHVHVQAISLRVA